MGFLNAMSFFVAKKVAFHNSNHNRFIRLGNKALDRLGLVWAVWVFLQEKPGGMFQKKKLEAQKIRRYFKLSN